MRAILFLLFVTWASGEVVKNVHQRFLQQASDDIQKQITRELQASYFFQAYAKYFSRADVALPGFVKYFTEVSQEENTHAERLMEYINKRGGQLKLAPIKLQDVCDLLEREFRDNSYVFQKDKPCICFFMSEKASAADKCSNRDDWFNGLMAMEDTLALERYVNQQLLDIHKRNKDDPHLADTLESEYLDEQVGDIKEIGESISQLKLVGKGLGEYTYDQYMDL